MRSGVLFGIALARTDVHYLLVDPSAISVCNILQTRVAMTKAAAILFGGEIIGGNVDALDAAIRNSDVWRAVNSLSEYPANYKKPFQQSTQERAATCEEYANIIEGAVSFGGRLVSGDGNPQDFVVPLQHLVDDHVKVLNVTSLGLNMDELRGRYFAQSVSTPMTVIVPSCAEPPFPVDENGVVAEDHLYDWNRALSQMGAQIFTDMADRLDSCDDCLKHFIEAVEDRVGIDLTIIKTMTGGVSERMRKMAGLDFDKAPTTLGGILGYLIKMAGAEVQITNAEQLAESVFVVMDSLNQEVLEGGGPLFESYKQLYEQLGC